MARRAFLKGVGGAAAAAVIGAGRGAAGQARIARIALVVDPSDAVAASPPVRWGLDQLRQALALRKVECRQYARLGEAGRSEFVVLIGGRDLSLPPEARPEGAEALARARIRVGGLDVVAVRGQDSRGLVYALTDLAEAVALEPDPLASLMSASPIRERPANAIR